MFQGKTTMIVSRMKSFSIQLNEQQENLDVKGTCKSMLDSDRTNYMNMDTMNSVNFNLLATTQFPRIAGAEF